MYVKVRENVRNMCRDLSTNILIWTFLVSLVVLFTILVSVISLLVESNNKVLDDSTIYTFYEEEDEIYNNTKRYNEEKNVGEVLNEQIVNETLCEFISQISIKYSNKVVTVCMYNEEIRVDIREFFVNVPSIRGIWFSLDEWKEFCRSMFEINKYVNFQMFYKE